MSVKQELLLSSSSSSQWPSSACDSSQLVQLSNCKSHTTEQHCSCATAQHQSAKTKHHSSTAHNLHSMACSAAIPRRSTAWHAHCHSTAQHSMARLLPFQSAAQHCMLTATGQHDILTAAAENVHQEGLLVQNDHIRKMRQGAVVMAPVQQLLWLQLG